MICKNCGAENKENSTYCKDCGILLEKEVNSSNKAGRSTDSYSSVNGKKPRNALLISVIILTFLLLGIVAAYLLNKNISIRKSEEKALNFELTNNYNAAAYEYEKLFSKTGQKSYNEKYNLMINKGKNAEFFKMGEDFFNRDNNIEALSYYLKINQEDEEHFNKAKEKIDYIMKEINEQLKMFIDYENYDSAITYADDYLKILKDNQNIISLKNQAIKLKDIYNNQNNSEVDTPQEEFVPVESYNQRVLEDLTYKLQGTYQYITSSVANIRSGPSLKYSITGKLYKGDSVYVYDAREDGERVWCNIGIGWVSYRTMNGELN